MRASSFPEIPKKMFIFSIFTTYILLLAHQAVAAILPPPNEVSISRITSSGSGCPENERSVSFSTSPDRTVLTAGFDKFHVYLGPGVSPRDRSKECDVRVEINYPRGYTFSVVETTYHGFATFDNTVSAALNTTYFFPGGDATRVSSTQTVVLGSATTGGSIFTRTETIPANARVRAPCGGGITTLAARTRIALTSSRATAQEVEFGAFHGEDSPITQQMKLEWEQCNP